MQQQQAPANPGQHAQLVQALTHLKPEYLKQEKSGARLVRQLFVDMIAASFFINGRFVHIEVVVDSGRSMKSST